MNKTDKGKRKSRLNEYKRIFEYIDELESGYERLAQTPGDLVWLQNLRRDLNLYLDELEIDMTPDEHE